MEETIKKLEYTLKDHDVKSNPYLTHQIQSVVESLRVVMELKKTRWEHDEVAMGECPCNSNECKTGYALTKDDYDRFTLLLASTSSHHEVVATSDSVVPHSSD